MVTKELLEILRCPESLGVLTYFPKGEDGKSQGFLLCEKSQRRYRVEEGIPVMLIDDSEKLDQAEVTRLLASR